MTREEIEIILQNSYKGNEILAYIEQLENGLEVACGYLSKYRDLCNRGKCIDYLSCVDCWESRVLKEGN